MRKSRLMRLVVTCSSLAIMVAVTYALTGWNWFAVMGALLISGVITFLVARVIHLEWQMATFAKSTKKRRRDVESQIESMGVQLRDVLSIEIRKTITSGSGFSRSHIGLTSGDVLSPSDAGPVIGRFAAAKAVTAERDARLYEILNQRIPSSEKCQLVGVVSPDLKRILSDGYDVMELIPAITGHQIQNSKAQMMIIDEEAFRYGAWFGADSAVGTLLFTHLSQIIKIAIDLDIAVWFVATGRVPNTYTNDLRKVATGVIGHNTLDSDWAEDIEIKFLHLIDKYLAGIENPHEDIGSNSSRGIDA